MLRVWITTSSAVQVPLLIKLRMEQTSEAVTFISLLDQLKTTIFKDVWLWSLLPLNKGRKIFTNSNDNKKQKHKRKKINSENTTTIKALNLPNDKEITFHYMPAKTEEMKSHSD